MVDIDCYRARIGTFSNGHLSYSGSLLIGSFCQLQELEDIVLLDFL